MRRFFFVCLMACTYISTSAQSTVNIKAVTGIGYAVDWVKINYDISGNSRVIEDKQNISVGQQRTFNIPANARNIRLTVKIFWSSKKVINNLRLNSNQNYCFDLSGSLFSSKYTTATCAWTPRGQVAVYDDELRSNVGLKRVYVEVLQGIKKIGHTYTDEYGRFRMNFQVKGKVKYKIKFADREGLKIIWGANAHSQSVTFQAIEGSLSYTFSNSRNRKHFYWATVYNATQFYKDYSRQDGLPFKNSSKISVMYGNHTSYAPVTGVQDAVIYRYGEKSKEIFSTVIHELAHITHSEIDRNNYTTFATERVLGIKRSAYGETWACGPEGIYTSRRYDPRGDEHDSYQYHPLSYYVYTDKLYIYPIVEDLIDNFNQRSRSNLRPIDRVRGYTLRQIAYALRDANSLGDWKRNLAKINNSSNVYLDEYFNQYDERESAKEPNNTIIKLKAVTGIGYAIERVQVDYTLSGNDQSINREQNISLGQQATITVPSGASNIKITIDIVGAVRKVVKNRSLNTGQTHCIHLKGSIFSPKYSIVNCSSY